MKWSYWRYILGGALVLLGVLTLLQVLNLFPTSGDVVGMVFAVLFGALGVSFLSFLVSDHKNWWAAIPGTILLSLGLLILLNIFAPNLGDRWGGPFFLAGMSLAFWLVYFLAPQNWWAIIPGGVMLTLAVVAGFPEADGNTGGGLFFLGLAFTFMLLWLVPVAGRRMTWPWIPAAVLAIMGVLLLLSQSSLINFAWPIVLILGGLGLLGRAYLRKA